MHCMLWAQRVVPPCLRAMQPEPLAILPPCCLHTNLNLGCRLPQVLELARAAVAAAEEKQTAKCAEASEAAAAAAADGSNSRKLEELQGVVKNEGHKRSQVRSLPLGAFISTWAVWAAETALGARQRSIPYSSLCRIFCAVLLKLSRRRMLYLISAGEYCGNQVEPATRQRVPPLCPTSLRSGHGSGRRAGSTARRCFQRRRA